MAEVKFGLQLPNFSFPPSDEPLFETVKRIARTAEAAGFDSFWVMDHFYQIAMVGAPEEPMLEGWLALAGVASATSRIRLGTMVSGNIYRNPALLAKMATTLDTISNGRAFLGVGAGWNRDEAEGYGFEFPEAAGDRLRRLREALRVVTAMLHEERPSFAGKFYSIDRAINNPRPVQSRLPVLIGGSGERVTLRLVAQYADACNLFGGPDQLRHLLGVLREHCQAVGRDYDSILKTGLGAVLIARDEVQLEEKLSRIDSGGRGRAALAQRYMLGTVDQVARQIRDRLDAGIEYPIVSLADAWDGEALELCAEAMHRA